MMKLITMRGRVAVQPFPDMSVKTTTSGSGPVKVTRIENKTGLVGLSVRFDSEDGRFKRGQIAFLRGSHFTAPWAKEIHEYVGDQYILAPDTAVEALAGE